MQDLQKQADELTLAIADAIDRLQLDKLEAQLVDLQKQTADPELWSDQERAQRLMKEQSAMEMRIKPWRELEKSAKDIKELAGMNDESLQTELEKQLKTVQKQYDAQKTELLYSGAFDDHNAILSIYAGAGGTDAQDWTQMLLRMYVRWAEANNFTVNTVDQSAGEEAGLKSVTLEIQGPFAYAKLRGEHGVHRLVRLSPFNSDNLRQTSFAKVEVLPKIDQPADVAIDEKDLKVDVYRSGGHGGQSVNTTDSAVRITHLPTGIVVAIQNERSQLQNKETALTILRSKLAQLQLEQHLENLADLKGPNEQAAWGNQIRSYVLHPYKQVKDLRTGHTETDAEGVLDGHLNPYITAYLEHTLAK
ncbi:MAG TPA: peptide chain release factor 2 [Patescibacteria group bacterium]|nr:peptide chain release factor 2 [Patescibacteria group bacterium]